MRTAADDALDASTPRRRLLEALRLDEGHNRGVASSCVVAEQQQRQQLQQEQRQECGREAELTEEESSVDQQISQLVHACLALGRFVCGREVTDGLMNA
jgi:hypothetical protein